ncbi:flavin-containing monooxygenase [Aquipseudomonas ullengensis]|uniref:NAD(P)/FAD-dependent oxidoreductase n=1 Tax=Aquipseudomonas ullengensis TaxID=2759166 RepID=A0A7W4LME5_9GAMM|nr:NAD(P)/FAD-dependent oxidoreductase [Pseudomonas ullengensis]MBB2495833.1 NAD(P)/FAD-dependent oxidoreductase [Pseudomonas ullengensis]
MNNKTPEQAPLRVLIIGSGFAGLGLAMRLRQQGVEDFLILEKGSEPGGTWRDNTYPGAACDVPSHLYSFSFEPKTDWTRRYAPQAEIFAYVRQCVAKYQLQSRIRCNSEVAEAEFDEQAALWRVTTADGAQFSARALVSACGQLNRPLYPKITGLERFAGESFHSARWRHDIDLSGKRVAVIGTGASAIQFVPQIMPKVAKLHLFQRSAAYVLPKPDRAYSRFELALMQRFPWTQKLDRGLQYVYHEARGVAFFLVPWLMKPYRANFLRQLARQVPEPELRAKLTPNYPLGCKRILISNDYYAALAQPQAEVVNEAIREISERGVVTADGREREVDVLIYGTGFAASDFLAPMRIRGLGGLDLNQAWRDGAEAYKGISVNGFPNLFLLYGPNTNLGHNSIIYMLESQFPYVLSCLQQLDQGVRYLDVRAPVQHAWNQRLQHDIEHSVWEQGCNSWYKNAAGKNTNNWAGFTFRYRQHTRQPDWSDYDLVR